MKIWGLLAAAYRARGLNRYFGIRNFMTGFVIGSAMVTELFVLT
jgi:hypothetical protein